MGENDGVSPKFLEHDHADTVGVVVVEDVRKGQNLTGWAMDTDDAIAVAAQDDIPLGHEIALKNIRGGETVFNTAMTSGGPSPRSRLAVTSTSITS